MKIHRVSGCCLQAAAMVRRMLVVQRKLHHTARMLADSRARFFSRGSYVEIPKRDSRKRRGSDVIRGPTLMARLDQVLRFFSRGVPKTHTWIEPESRIFRDGIPARSRKRVKIAVERGIATTRGRV